MQDNNGYASSGVSYSADGSMNRFGAITGRFDYATQTIILDPIRLAGGSITLTGQIISVGNGNLIVANGYASVRIDNQTTYALVTGDIDVSTYRKGRIEIIDTARGQRDLYELNGADQVVHGLEQVRPGDERRRGAAGLGLESTTTAAARATRPAPAPWWGTWAAS